MKCVKDGYVISPLSPGVPVYSVLVAVYDLKHTYSAVVNMGTKGDN